MNNLDSVNTEVVNNVATEKSKQNLFKNFIISNLDYLISTILIILLFIFTLIINKCQPFGKNSIILSDSHEQIAVFFNHIFNILEGKSPLFYTNYFGKGMSIFSTLEYMHLNPFYIIVLFGGRNNIELMLTISILFMLIFNALIFTWFARKYFKNINKFLLILLTQCFSFSSYISYNFAFITWLIFPALSLMLLDKFITYLKTGKIAGLIVIYTWYILNCFSVGISTSILLFMISTLYIYLCTEKGERNKKFAGLLTTFISTALICIIILFPAIIDYTQSGRNSSFILNMLEVSFFSLKTKIPVILFDLAILIIALIYLVKQIKNNKKDKFTKFLYITFALLFAPAVFDSILKMLCFSKYIGFAGRFYFLNEIFIFTLALKYFNENNHTANEETSKKFTITYYILTGILLIGFVITAILLLPNASLYIKYPVSRSNKPFKYLLPAFVIVLLIIVISIIFNKLKKFQFRYVKFSIIIAMVLTIISNYSLFSLKTASTYTDYDKIVNITTNASVKGNFKLFDCTYSETYYYNINSENLRKTDAFSSLINNKLINSFKTLGYQDDKVLTFSSTGTLISDTLMGNKYYLSENKQDRPYLKLIEEKDGLYLYDNILVSNSIFVANNDINFSECSNFIEVFEKLKESLGIDGELFKVSKFEVEEFIDSDTNETKYKYTYTPDKAGILYFNAFFYKNESNSALETNELNFLSYTLNSVADAGFLNEGETINYIINFEDGIEDYLKNCSTIFLNYETAKQICEKLIEKQTNFEYTKDGYIVSLNANLNEDIIITMPNIEGYKYYVNGQETEPEEVLGGVVRFSNLSGDVTIQAKYNYPHIKLWIILAISLTLITTLILLTYHYTKFKHIEKLIGFAMISVFIIMFAIIYCFGGLMSICELSYRYFF